MSRKTCSPWVALLALTFGQPVLAAEKATPGGAAGATVVANFQLPLVSGGTWSLAESHDRPYLVLAFIGTECPLMQLYAPRLQQIAETYGERGVEVVAIDSNAQDTAEEIAAFAREHHLTFPVLKDADNRVADALGATRTPEVFVLDAARTVRYHGRIDDQGRVGFIRLKAERQDLVAALDELLASQPVSQSELPAVGCLIGRKHQTASAPAVTYAKQVSRIFQARCVECHRPGEIGPFAMDNYDDVAGWADMIREVVEQDRMPPWFASPEHGKFRNDARLTPEEKETIFAWVDAGAPLGDPADLPEPRSYVSGWNIGHPDQVVAMTDAPFAVPAEGTLAYKHFLVDPGWTEDKWLSAAEVRPGDRSVVHHVFVICLPPGKSNMFTAIFEGGLIGGYAPGTPAFQAPDGVARRVPAGSKLVFQMHYTPNGRATEDLTRVGFKFCDPASVQQEVEVIGASNWFFMIPPGAENHELKSQYRFTEDRYLRNLLPHMHLRGKSFRFVARYPDGRREVLLDVPRFDFNWQIEYELDELKLMPKGTVLECTAHYDNSANNPANPDPTVAVPPGEQTWDEMMIGWFSTMTLPRTAAAE